MCQPDRKHTRMTKFNWLVHLRIAACNNVIAVIYLIRFEWVRHSCAVWLLHKQLTYVCLNSQNGSYLFICVSFACGRLLECKWVLALRTQRFIHKLICCLFLLVRFFFSFFFTYGKRNSVDGSSRGTLVLVSLGCFFLYAISLYSFTMDSHCVWMQKNWAHGEADTNTNRTRSNKKKKHNSFIINFVNRRKIWGEKDLADGYNVSVDRNLNRILNAFSHSLFTFLFEAPHSARFPLFVLGCWCRCLCC